MSVDVSVYLVSHKDEVIDEINLLVPLQCLEVEFGIVVKTGHRIRILVDFVNQGRSENFKEFVRSRRAGSRFIHLAFLSG
jgi:hypothetical protein